MKMYHKVVKIKYQGPNNQDVIELVECDPTQSISDVETSLRNAGYDTYSLRLLTFTDVEVDSDEPVQIGKVRYNW